MAKAKSRRRGAPRKRAAERKSVHVTVWMTVAHKELLDRAARAADETLAHWVRKIAVHEARRRLEVP